jgi:hypothetical protein
VTAQTYLLGGGGLAGDGDLVAHLRATVVVEQVRSGQALVIAVDASLASIDRSWTDEEGPCRRASNWFHRQPSGPHHCGDGHDPHGARDWLSTMGTGILTVST